MRECEELLVQVQFFFVNLIYQGPLETRLVYIRFDEKRCLQNRNFTARTNNVAPGFVKAKPGIEASIRYK